MNSERSKYMTTEQFIESVEALAFEAIDNKVHDARYIDVRVDDLVVARVGVDSQYRIETRSDAEERDLGILFELLCGYASTPVTERESRLYKLKCEIPTCISSILTSTR